MVHHRLDGDTNPQLHPFVISLILMSAGNVQWDLRSFKAQMYPTGKPLLLLLLFKNANSRMFQGGKNKISRMLQACAIAPWRNKAQRTG